MARPPRWQATLDASIEEACLAVRMYNDPAERRSFEAFVIHMHLAWLYLLHAEFVRDGVDHRYWDSKRKNRLIKVEGEAKRWELERSVRERWPSDSDPVRANIGLFVRLRNRLEHRHAQADQSLMVALAGYSHAHLLNYEAELTDQFGADTSLATRLRLPLFVGTFSPQGESALRRLHTSLPQDVARFVTEYETGLTESTTSDSRYELRLRATIELAKKDPEAVAIQFTHYDDLSDNERTTLEALGRRGQVVVRNRPQPVSGHGRLLPKRATSEIADKVPFIFNARHFSDSWKRLKVRPPAGAKNPEHTNPDWCEYDEPTKSYRFTRAYVNHLVKKCSTPEGFLQVTGRTATLKDSPTSTGPTARPW